MKSIAHLLPEFSQTSEMQLVSEADREEDRLRAFEQGYSAGWEDATKALQESSTQGASQLAASISDASFTFQEAYSAVLRDIEPVISRMISLILPEIARETIAQHLIGEIRKSFRESPASALTISINEAQVETLTDALASSGLGAVKVQSDPGLDALQAIVGTEKSEREIDFGRLIKEFHQSLASLALDAGKELKHG